MMSSVMALERKIFSEKYFA